MYRRTFFRFMAALGAAAASGTFWPQSSGAASQPDLEAVLTAAPDKMPLFPGQLTGVWRYKGEVVKGDSAQLRDMPDSWLGPVFRVRRGQRVRIRFKNRIPQESIIHWHGLHVPPEDDGHPRLTVPGGEDYVYDFTIANRAGTYWYHPHPHGLTGNQVYGGMAGLFLISDQEEQALDLPAGEYDLPLVIQDRTFAADNRLVYVQNPMQRMTGFLGDRAMINGRAGNEYFVKGRSYRLRILNASNSRLLRLGWSDGRNLQILGTDGGLLDKTLVVPDIMLGPAERIDLWADFADMQKGAKVSLQSLPFNPGSGPMGMMGNTSRLPAGSQYELVRFQVTEEEKGETKPPERLASLERLDPEQAVNRDNPRRFFLEMNHMQPTINGRTFNMSEVAPDEMVRLGTTEIWEFVNSGGMMAMPHPMHIHGLSFQVIGRFGGPGYRFLDKGWKDSVLVMPGERVVVIMRFLDHKGLYLYHCHNLEHEDLGMMRNYLVSSLSLRDKRTTAQTG
ncbi:MAG: multicopper oxidase family protein [Desulfohalobiaceae bacterium]|nr:multicopper oxidase family protein [Desulfohalobiaceae bacterium]